jgi:uncharacterized membrane protein
MDIFLKIFIDYSGLIFTQLTLGKKGSFVFAIFFDMDLYIVSLVIITTDIMLMFFVERLFHVTSKHVFPFTLLQRKAERLEQKIKQSHFAEKIIKVGRVSTIILTATPFAGGVWSGLILARILQINTKEAYWMVSIGTVIGCLIFLLAAEGIINLI